MQTVTIEIFNLHLTTIKDFYTFTCILNSTANAALFFPLNVQTDNNLKIIMANYYLHSISIFLHYQIQFSRAYAWVLAFEYKKAFLYMHMLIFFQKLVQN